MAGSATRPAASVILGLVCAAVLAGWGLAGLPFHWPRFEEHGPLDPAVAGRPLAVGEPVPKGFGVFDFVVREPVKRVAIRDWATRKLAWYVDAPRLGGEYRVALRPAYYVSQHYTGYEQPEAEMGLFTVKDGADADEFNGGDELPRIDPPDPHLAGVTLGANDPLPPGASVIRYTVKDPNIDRLILRLLSQDRAIVWHLDHPAEGTYQIVLPPGPYSLEQHSPPPTTRPWDVPPRVIYEVMLAAHEQKSFTSKSVGLEY